MYTKITQNTKFVYILYTKIVQIKILYDQEYTKMYIKFLQIYKKCTIYAKLVYIYTKNNLKLEIISFIHANNVQAIQNLYN